MLFRNRIEAGEKLAEALKKFQGQRDAMVLALPRGGVVIGRIVADILRLPLDIVVPRKIGAQGNEEYAIGAITETGDAVWNENERDLADSAYLARVIEKEQKEALRRLEVYRKGLPARNFKGKTVIIVDDGIATGLTIRAAVKTVRQEGAAKVVVAVPVCAANTAQTLKREVDELITIETPRLFFAIGNFYEEFPQLEDEEVVRLL